jgi:acyl dehydratase
MSVPSKHILQQGPVLAALGRAALAAMKEQIGINGVAKAKPALPGPELSEIVPPRPRGLVRDYVKCVGGDPGRYRSALPPHLFPQWSFPVASRTLAGIPYPIVKVMNGGCRLEIRSEIPIDEPLEIRGRLVGIDDDGYRAVLHQELVTSTKSAPDALIAHLYAIVPLKRRDGPAKEKARVPEGAREIGYGKIRADAGLDFAKLTGDFNPIHWIPAYAKASGFQSTILHGFATLARAMEGLQGTVIAPGQRIGTIDVKFGRPLLLPARVGTYVDGAGGVFVGDAPGGPAYLTGSYEVMS